MISAPISTTLAIFMVLFGPVSPVTTHVTENLRGDVVTAAWHVSPTRSLMNYTLGSGDTRCELIARRAGTYHCSITLPRGFAYDVALTVHIGHSSAADRTWRWHVAVPAPHLHTEQHVS